MEYSIDKLCKLAGVTSRTLRHYHRIGLLMPLRTTGAGYRVYGPREVDRLQHILFYRALGVELQEIGRILDSPAFDPGAALQSHLAGLMARRAELDRLIATVTQTIESQEGLRTMHDSEKFQGFKNRLIEENEAQYGEEIRRKYGAETVDASAAKLRGMSQADYAEMEALGAHIIAGLETAVAAGADPLGPQGRDIALLHRRWLAFSWASYSLEAHQGLARMYVDDARFTAYYDSRTPGCAAFLRDAVCGLEE